MASNVAILLSSFAISFSLAIVCHILEISSADGIELDNQAFAIVRLAALLLYSMRKNRCFIGVSGLTFRRGDSGVRLMFVSKSLDKME